MIKGAKNIQRGGISKGLCFNERRRRDGGILNLPVLLSDAGGAADGDHTPERNQSNGEHPHHPPKRALTPDDEIDVLASGVAHVVDSSAVVEASVGGSDRPQEEHWPPDLSAEGKGARVAGPGHGGGGEAGDDLTVEEHVLPGVHDHCVVHRQPNHRRS